MIDYRFWINCAILIATIFAIVFGPIKAVRITRQEDEIRERRNRKYAILTDLMRTRIARIDPLHVSALNLIELEFYGSKFVLPAYRSYANYLNSHFPREIEAAKVHANQGDDLFTELLFQIANDLEYKFDKRDLSRLGYFPLGLSSYHDNSHANAHLIREILEGRRALPISNFISDTKSFPPAPEKKMIENNQA